MDNSSNIDVSDVCKLIGDAVIGIGSGQFFANIMLATLPANAKAIAKIAAYAGSMVVAELVSANARDKFGEFVDDCYGMLKSKKETAIVESDECITL